MQINVQLSLGRVGRHRDIKYHFKMLKVDLLIMYKTART